MPEKKISALIPRPLLLLTGEGETYGESSERDEFGEVTYELGEYMEYGE
ncbi:MAG: hypothetical protein O2954_07030 [bacterium]|nr:hypothetical protein [bacterium]